MNGKHQENKTSKERDQTLMLAYAQGDTSAFDLLYNKHKVAVYRFFIRQNLTSAEAEELCHDTWLKLINNRTSYQANALFSTYLFTIARRLAIDYAQKKSVIFEKQNIHIDLSNSDNVNVINISNDDNSQIADTNNHSQLNYSVNQTMANAIKRQISALPYDQREVFLLKQEAGFSIDDIAKITFQNKEKVKSCWRYALQKMRKGLSLYDN